MKPAIACAVLLLLAGGVVAWRVTRPPDTPQRAFSRWIDSLATADAHEFCSVTTPVLRDANFSEVGAHSGGCETRAKILLGRYQRYWEVFAGARATYVTGGPDVAAVATRDIVLPDDTHLNDWIFALFPHPANQIRLVRRDGTWLVDG
jgi:hypothetical protein